MDDRTSGRDPLAALGAHLAAHGYRVDLTTHGLKVANPRLGTAEDTITCRPRPEDGGRPWFYTASGEPLADADRIIDAKMMILGHLAARDER